MRSKRALFSANRLRTVLWPVGLVLMGCVSTEHQSRDWSDYRGPGAEYFQAEEIVFPYEDDPLEPANRVVAAGNYFLLQWLLPPFAKAYRFFLPEVVRVHIDQGFENWKFPIRVVNNLLQGKFEEAGVETSRFAVNTTVGVLGFFDPAQDWGMRPHPEDFGQTFAAWGWESSTYLNVPLLGPSTVRDSVGFVPDAFVDPASYATAVPYVREFAKLSNTLEQDLRVIESTYDAYEAGRTLYTLTRRVDVTDFEWHEDDSGPTQTLKAIFLEPEEESFVQRRWLRKAPADPQGRELPYNLWLQPKPAPVLYVIPGFGGHRLGGAALALAEIGYKNGHSVVTVSSPTNWEFMRHGASVPVPGFGPVDAHDLHVALTMIDRQLELEHPGHFGARRIVGLSMGGHETLLMAAGHAWPLQGEASSDLLEFDRVLALNPPVDVEYGLRQVDRFYNAPLAFPPAERATKIEEIFGKVLYLSQGKLEPDMSLPFSEIESQFLIGLSFRLDLQFMIMQSRELDETGVLLTPSTALHRAPAFREAAEFSYMEYVYAFLLPYYARHDPDVEFSEAGARRLFELADLRSIQAELESDPRVYVLTNEKDFLLREDDMKWLRETLGERLSLYAEGGHLGSLYREYMQKAIAKTLATGRPAQDSAR